MYVSIISFIIIFIIGASFVPPGGKFCSSPRNIFYPEHDVPRNTMFPPTIYFRKIYLLLTFAML